MSYVDDISHPEQPQRPGCSAEDDRRRQPRQPNYSQQELAYYFQVLSTAPDTSYVFPEDQFYTAQSDISTSYSPSLPSYYDELLSPITSISPSLPSYYDELLSPITNISPTFDYGAAYNLGPSGTPRTIPQEPCQPSRQPQQQRQQQEQHQHPQQQLLPKPSQSQRRKKVLHCLYPDCNKTSARPADMARHITNVHNRDVAPRIDCPEPGCRRVGAHGIRRHDKLLEHLRDKHHLNIPKRAPGRRTSNR